MKKALRITLTLIAIIASVSVALAITNHVNASLINTYIDTFEPVDNSDRLTPQKDEYGYYFTTDGEFNVMHLTDVHLCGGIFASEMTKRLSTPSPP